MLDAWRDIKPETVTYSFKKCGISNNLDGTEDDILWEDPAMLQPVDQDETEEESEGAFDPYDDRITREEFEELFNYDDDESDFEGF